MNAPVLMVANHPGKQKWTAGFFDRDFNEKQIMFMQKSRFLKLTSGRGRFYT